MCPCNHSAQVSCLLQLSRWRTTDGCPTSVSFHISCFSHCSAKTPDRELLESGLFCLTDVELVTRKVCSRVADHSSPPPGRRQTSKLLLLLVCFFPSGTSAHLEWIFPPWLNVESLHRHAQRCIHVSPDWSSAQNVRNLPKPHCNHP